MDLGTKVVWFVIILGIVTTLVIAVIKIGDIVVKRRTAALLAEHGGENDNDEPSEDDSDRS